MKHLPRIGTTAQVSLFSGRYADIPAKVDTGADSSAVWASEISEAGGRLSFVLFDSSSHYYDGKVIKTRDYTMTKIKNSFGQVERRYKTPLTLRIEGRTIRANVTLANRSSNRYPVLIGRRTLSGKFLVDVSQRPVKPFNVLLLSVRESKVIAKLAANISANNPEAINVTFATYEDLRFDIGDHGEKITVINGERDIADFDLVYFKATTGNVDVAASAAQYLNQRGVSFIDKAVKDFSDASKLFQYVMLSRSDLAIPRSIFMLPKRMAQSYDYLAGQLGLPFVLKDVHGSNGKQNYLVTDEASFREACRQSVDQGVRCIAQAFIPNDGDYRVLIFGGKVELVVHRRAAADTHLNNTSKGGEATLVSADKLPAAIRSACILAARLLGRQVAGVDIVQDKKTGLWYCFEVNEAPQLASGCFTTEKHRAFTNYLERRLNK